MNEAMSKIDIDETVAVLISPTKKTRSGRKAPVAAVLPKPHITPTVNLMSQKITPEVLKSLLVVEDEEADEDDTARIIDKSITFYLEQHPMLLVRMLQVLTPTLDHARAVHMFRKADALDLVMPYLKSVQKENLTAVNEAINEMLTDDEDYEVRSECHSACRWIC